MHDIEARSTYPLITPSHPPVTAYATWSPTGEAIAFVHDNDLYIKPNARQSTSYIRLTTSGSATHFNGVPDWVYEEEVFSADYALWWSPDSRKVAFVESDETNVDVYTFPVYNPDSNSYAVHPYTEEVAMRYPKPGYNNPEVDVHIFDLGAYLSGVDAGAFDRIDEYLSRLTWTTRQPRGKSIVMEVAWVGSENLIVKEVNRVGNEGSVVLFDTQELSLMSSEIRGTVVRRLGKNGEEGDDGWIESVSLLTPDSSLQLTMGLIPTTAPICHAFVSFIDQLARPRRSCISRPSERYRWISSYRALFSLGQQHAKICLERLVGGRWQYTWCGLEWHCVRLLKKKAEPLDLKFLQILHCCLSVLDRAKYMGCANPLAQNI